MLNDHKILKKVPLAAAVISALGLSAMLPVAHAAVSVADGDYTITIVPSPAGAGWWGSDGAWNSSFSFGLAAPTSSSQKMLDSTTTISTPSDKTCGDVSHAITTGVLGDTYAGRVGIRIGSNTITVSSFQKDPIFNTAGRTFLQYFQSQNSNDRTTSVVGYGTITPATGAMTLNFNDPVSPNIGRRGSVSGTFPRAGDLCDERWDYNDFNTFAWVPFTTGSASNNDGTINGAPLTSLGDINGDGVADYHAILVSGGHVGSDWGGFFGASYFEVWNVNILSAVIKPTVITTPVNTPKALNVVASSTGITPLTVTGETDGSNGTVAIAANDVTYTPNLNFTGVDSFTYTVTNGDGVAKTVTASVCVSTAGAVCAISDIMSTKQNTAVALNVAANDVITNTPAGSSIPTAPANGTASITTQTAGNLTITYTPNDGFLGQDSFIYRLRDGTTTLTGDATVTVSVNSWGLTSNGTYALGTLAISKGSTDGKISRSDVQSDSTVTNQCVGGCYDFKVTGVTIGTVDIVLPRLTAAITPGNITDGLHYRKYMNAAWKTFDTSLGDSIASQPLAPGGGCPKPNVGTWHTWTNAVAGSDAVGDQCIRLTIADNGPNDSNPSTGTIEDPSGAGSTTAQIIIDTGDLSSFGSSSQGCTISPNARKSAEGGEWWLVAGFLVWLRALLWRRERSSGKQV